MAYVVRHMGLKILQLSGFLSHGFDTLIDARSPAEYAFDHIPGAINLQVLSDAERAHVGTIYKQQNAFDAKKIGAALVARNVAAHLDGPLADRDGGWRPLVYCWRGGQRSGSFKSILSQVGWRADVIDGGYQQYRRLVAKALYDQPLSHNLIVLDGNTGTAKTELLQMLQDRGEQVVDLEALANHRGSVFGNRATVQPSQKAFEGALASGFDRLDRSRPVWLEAESSKIGRLIIPPMLWQAMNTAPRLSISAPLTARASYLVRTYGDIVHDSAALIDRLNALIPHQGREQVQDWLEMAAQGQFQQLAQGLMQQHYDPSYGRSRAQRADNVMAEIQMDSLCETGLGQGVDRLLKLATDLKA